MAAITITDLHQDRALDCTAIARIRGAAGAPFVYGWIQPYIPPHPAIPGLPVMNFYQINNTSIFYAEKLINQVQNIEINNSAPSSNITTVLIGTQAAS